MVSKLFEVIDEWGHPTMIPFHRVIRVVKAESAATMTPAVIFCMDGGSSVIIPLEKGGEEAWGKYREWVSSLSVDH